MKYKLLALLAVILVTGNGSAEIPDTRLKQLVFEQHLGATIPGNLRFRDENGRNVILSEYWGRKPIILVPGYYGCPMLCSLVGNALVESMQDLRTTVGTDFEVIHFSIDPSETASVANAKKKSYLNIYRRNGASNGWHFLTGNKNEIDELCRIIGFPYEYDATIRQYAHPAGFLVLTPEGKIVRYFFGVDFPPRDLDAALAAASSGKTLSPARQWAFLCFHYGPLQGKYGALIMGVVRVFGIGTVIGIAFLIVRFSCVKRVRKT